jgi:hypothetical protein
MSQIWVTCETQLTHNCCNKATWSLTWLKSGFKVAFRGQKGSKERDLASND